MIIILYFHDPHYTQRNQLPGFLPATYFSLTRASTLLILEFLLLALAANPLLGFALPLLWLKEVRVALLSPYVSTTHYQIRGPIY